MAITEFHPLLTANINTLWAGVMVETLRRCGVAHAVIAPGSRSAPLTLALALNPEIETVAALDERSAAFFALGLAKRTCEPVVLVCTSGTAAANFLPAVVEAHYSNVPLIILTADRPAHLRGVGAGQAIDQVKLYGSYAAYAHELPLPRFDLLGSARQAVIQAHLRACYPQGGVAHLNVPFEEPLAPVAGAEPLPHFDFSAFFAGCQRASVPDIAAALPATLPWDLEDALAFGARGLIIAGPYALGRAGGMLEPLLKIGRASGWPVLADVLSRLRHHEVEGLARVSCYDAILRDETLATTLVPDFVLQIGPLPTSKVLRQWLARHQPRRFVVSGSVTELHDPLHGPVTPIVGSLTHLAEGFAMNGPSAYSRSWEKAQRAMEERIATSLPEQERQRHGAGNSALLEPRWPQVLAEALPAKTPIFIASSMPVRDAESFWPLSDKGFRWYFSRGANGIDGTLSTALGIAHGADKPAVLVTGDLSFLHDQNGLLLAPWLRGGLTVLLINNNGGGIFEHLPIAGFEPPFEAYFATPQHVDFGKLAAAHGIKYHQPDNWADVAKLFTKLPKQGLRIVEIRTDRKADAAVRKARR